MADIPDLTHQWYRSTAGYHCSLCAAPLVGSGTDPCPARVRAWGAEERAAGAAEARARIVAWLRTRASNRYERSDVCNYVGGNTTAAYAKATEAEAAADAIERGEDRTP